MYTTAKIAILRNDVRNKIFCSYSKDLSALHLCFLQFYKSVKYQLSIGLTPFCVIPIVNCSLIIRRNHNSICVCQMGRMTKIMRIHTLRKLGRIQQAKKELWLLNFEINMKIVCKWCVSKFWWTKISNKMSRGRNQHTSLTWRHCGLCIRSGHSQDESASF